MGIFNKKSDNTAAVKTKKTVPDTKESMKDLYGSTAVKKTIVEKEGKTVSKTIVKRGFAYRILVKPLVTEKASRLGVENKYVFAVALDANKIEIAKAINEVYGIKPVAVNIINLTGKNVRYGRMKGKRKDWKKAIVELPKGKTIKVYEGV